ncbi:MAG: hypothetical protein B7Y25_01120 [Alphaproteobacteria bacterium 16-39-46]|nr:MAG: hypothetical protein B7Y25_01120 [Alphaproteobacteria bacterium 16-39-46]OZA44156.1 MAG: hypothetical protein B7X84_01365 [Alphaproteobacteria bacterium 17-39-52]HQS83500.1 CvpA family protein [Alphaproteobacteria bacterium]HQS93268.1 CvpA family protein [Alphaproteobacteria bacterium]
MNTLLIPWTDLGIIALILISGLVGFARGFTRETLGLLSWGGALVLALMWGDLLKPFLTPYISSTLVVDILSGAILFFISLLILVLLSKGISSQIKGSLLAGLDRSFGFLFGLIRGVVLIILAYLALTFFLNPSMWPQTLTSSRLLPFVEQGSRTLVDMLPDTDLPNALKRHLPTHISPTPQELLKTLSTLSPTENQ